MQQIHHMQQQFQMQWWPQQQQQQPQAAPSMTLTPFWPSAPAALFQLAEATFHRLHVVDPNLQLDLTLPALQESTVAQLQDILQAAENLLNPNESLKADLIRQHSPNVLEQLNRIAYAQKLSGQLPSQLIQTLLTHIVNLPVIYIIVKSTKEKYISLALELIAYFRLVIGCY